jgi:hypothetical protein
MHAYILFHAIYLLAYMLKFSLYDRVYMHERKGKGYTCTYVRRDD